jgi:hypothetical protein
VAWIDKLTLDTQTQTRSVIACAWALLWRVASLSRRSTPCEASSWAHGRTRLDLAWSSISAELTPRAVASGSALAGSAAAAACAAAACVRP